MIRKSLIVLCLALPTMQTSATAVAPEHRYVAPVHQLVSAETMRKWTRVYICETHNWAQRGHYAGGLGITQWNWEHHGGLRFARAPYLAKPEQQVYVATVIQHGLPVPDQTSTCKDW